MSDPLQVLHDQLGAEVIPVPEQPPLPLAYEPEPPGPDEVSDALQELHSAEVLEIPPDPPLDEDEDPSL
ncbi:hypothetical protein [Streptomyces phage phiScoe25]|nr:hypothetical protein [Streptomyces phage phiScoe25]